VKLYDFGRAPNPRRVRVFLAEKGIDLPSEQVDIGAMQHKSPEFSAINPLQRVPALVLDDGTVITESMAICRYFEELRPEPPLFGRGAKEAALVEMWNRRMELNLLNPVAAVFRHLHPAMKEREQPQVPEWGEANKAKVSELLEFLDVELKDRLFIAGDHYTVADITGMIAVDFMRVSKMAVPERLGHVRRWHGQVSERPSARA
jgi:glutathione S-transferase